MESPEWEPWRAGFKGNRRSKLSGFSPDNSWCCSGVCTASTCQLALPTSGLQGDGVGHQSDHWQSVMDSVIPAWITLEDVPWSSLVTTQIWCAGLRADLVKRKRSVTIWRTGSYWPVPGLLLLSTTCPWCTTAGETERSWFLPDWTGWFPGSSGLLQRSLLLVVYFKFAPLWTLQIPPVVTDVFPYRILFFCLTRAHALVTGPLAFSNLICDLL